MRTCLYIIAGLTLLMASIGSGMGWWLYHQGRTAEHAVCLEAQAKAADARDKALHRAFDQADRIASEDLDVATASNAERIRVIKEIRYVQRAAKQVKTPDCRDLGPDWFGLYNRGIAAANGSPGNADSAAPATAASAAGTGAQQ